ncbi:MULTISPECIES: methionyl-tRNA formyltransferase [Cycloclasticus]|uniref:Methionyl-tRNA formyltransferase n=1 Tax=Cycloclasticus pugetii TaxID=34068 RepID=A0AB33YZQ8_9GAMM|nr:MULTISPECIES: methionyl-tRNA formyltransferase [Cycloclasticus]ATI02328.1 methionyl-tRNA formyltransferase [Cycloclasticus sp. PY97N]EPD12417.1 methionyl-tRNA formyltransferase [Cycloclasticus pugetii]
MNIIFAGTPDFSVPTLQALMASQHHVCAVYTQPDRPAGRGRKVQLSPVKQCALDANIPIEQPVNFKSAASITTLEQYQADLMIVVAYGIILPDLVLNTPRFGCINIHASLLPRWRGAAPIQRAILSGDKETGITLMQMDTGLDTGDMLSKTVLPIQPEDTSSSLHNKLSTLGANALIDLLPLVDAQQLSPSRQNNNEATYAHKLSKQEALIDWSKPAADVQRSIQGYNPWPVAHTLLNNKPLRIWQATVTQLPTSGQPGEVNTEKNKLFVACGDYFIEVNELQPANKRRMSASDYLSAHHINALTLG